MCYFVIHRKHSKAYKGYNHTHSTSLHQVINHKKRFTYRPVKISGNGAIDAGTSLHIPQCSVFL
ncbi:hypothetical protein A8M56_18890 [Yersinia pestis]|nr:hypothetical protein A8M56_18890 [Yersinia pestis]